MHHDLIGRLRRVICIPFTPIIANGIRENIPRLIKRGARNRAPDGRIPLQTMLGILIPEMERPIATRRAKRAVDGVKRNRVDRIHIADIACIRRAFAMAFETEIRAGVFILDVLDGAAALDGADGEARGVCEAADDACLVFQRGLHGFVEFGGLVEVDDVDVAVCGADDEELVFHVHGVDAFLAFESADGRRLAQVPEFHGFVP